MSERVCCLLRCCCALLVLLAQPLLAAPLPLERAQLSVTVDGVTRESTTTLPYHWDRLHHAQPGAAIFDIQFERPSSEAASVAEGSDGPYALYFARIGTAYTISLNGHVIARGGELQRGGGADYAKAPRLVPISPQLLQDHNLLRVQIRADGGRRAGLAAPLLGTETELDAIYKAAYRGRLGVSLVVAIFSLVVAGIALVLWLTQPRVAHDAAGAPQSRRDPIYLFAAVAELGWALRTGDAVWENPPLDWPWWGIVVSSAYAAYIASMTLFCQQLAGLQSRLSNQLLACIAISGALFASWALLRTQPMVWTVWLGLIALGFVAYGVYYSVRAIRYPDSAHVMVAIAVMANVLAGLRDWIAVRLSGDFYGDGAWIRYTSVLFGLTLLTIVVTRFRAASSQAHELMHTLAERVAQKETELKASYGKLEELARDQERMAERTRILRDMHDGVGSHISAAIRQLQSGKASNGDVLQTLRDSLDQLKLTIDSMHLPPGDVTALLANMRYRLEPRFASSGIDLQWDVDLLEPLPRLDAPALRQLQYMVFEALSNVLQHAQAHTLRIEAHEQGAAGVVIRVVDDGRGFDTALAARKGLLSLGERARAIGATLQIASEPGRTAVEIRLD